VNRHPMTSSSTRATHAPGVSARAPVRLVLFAAIALLACGFALLVRDCFGVAAHPARLIEQNPRQEAARTSEGGHDVYDIEVP
jgi:hypothetical protein